MNTKRNPSVLIIGAGATGMLSAIRLKEVGITDITIIEKAERVGGTWRENTYPGIACDIPSHHYCYSFEPAAWSHQCAVGAELQDYMEHVGQKYGVTETVRFNEIVTSCVYDDHGKWTVTTDKDAVFVVDFVIAATGILHNPKYPDIPGLDDFARDSWHTAEWNHDVDLNGKRIGVIGTGSTSHQAIPELVNAGHDVTVFQRTPQWVFPMPNVKFPEWLRNRWKAKPSRTKMWKWLNKTFTEQFFVRATIGAPIQSAILKLLTKSYLRFGIRDKELRAKLTPDYGVGCKRLVVNFTFYPAIQKPNVDLITDGIERIEPVGVRTKDGKLHEIDVLVLATGFHNFSFMRPMNVVGRAGHTIEDSWGGGRYRTSNAILMEHFPNYFLMLGPGTPIGNNSVIGMAEEQIGYVLKLIDIWRQERADEIEPTPQAVAAFGEYIKSGLEGTVWVGGCQSWYQDVDGIPAIFPYPWSDFVKLMSSVDPSELTMRKIEKKETAHAV